MPRYIVPHHGGLKYVRAIPKDVQALEGRKVWTAYLKGLSAEDAKTRALELAAEHDKRAKVLRNLAEPDKRLLKSKGGLARCQVDAAQADYLAAVLWSHSLGKPATDPAHRTIAALLDAHAPTHNIVAKLNGKAGADPRLFDLVPLWQHIAKPRTAKTIDKANMHVRRFAELVGDYAPREVTRQHAIAYRDALEKLPGLSADSVEDTFTACTGFFAVAMGRRVLLISNPFSGVKARKGENGKFADQGRKPFTSTHARLIFKRLAEVPTDDQMVMRLLAYHGMRAGEACQLRACDVRRLAGSMSSRSMMPRSRSRTARACAMSRSIPSAVIY